MKNVKTVLRKIVHVTPSYPPSLGGLEKVVQILAGKQKQLGYDVSVVTSDKDAAAGDNAAEQFIVKRLKTFVLANTRVIPGLLPQLLKLKKNDVVHLHFASAFAPELVWLCSKIKGYKYVAHMHLDFVATGKFGFLLRLYKPFVLKYVLRSAANVIVFTEEQRAAMVKRYGIDPSRVSAIPNGVEEKFYMAKERSLHRKTRLLFVGRLAAQKNLSLLMDSLKGISDNFETTIVGEGDLKERLQEQVKTLGLKNVKFVGRKSGDELMEHYKKADVFVLPSEREGMPLVLLEALAMGLPVVATDVTGSRDVVAHGKNGLLVPFGDAPKFAEALTRVAGKTEYAKLSKGAYKSAQKYSWDKVAAKFANLYKAVVSKPANPQFKLWHLVLPLLAAANAAYFLPNFFGALFTLGIFLTVPGYLLFCNLRHNLKSRWTVAVLSLGLSLLVFIVGGLALNNLYYLGLESPLSTLNVFVLLDAVTIGLLAAVRNKPVRLPKIKLPALEPAVFFVALTLLPLLAIGGAVRLNNGGSNILTMVLFALIPLLLVLLVWRKNQKSLYPYALLMMGMAVLFSTSLRGWFITGHDIHHEFRVFQDVLQSGFWNVAPAIKDPYNASLSITILPTLIAKITHIFDPYIYKAVFQIIFAVGIVPIYLLVKRFVNARMALIGAFLFVSFPPFINDMPFLNRQEIAFVFFGLLLMTAFLRMARKPKTILVLLLLLGLIFSHYSSSYVAIALLFMAWAFYKVLAAKRVQINTLAIPLLSLPIISAALLFTFLWNTQITDTSAGLKNTITQTIKGMFDDSAAQQSSGVSYSIFSSEKQNPVELLNEHAGDNAAKIQYVPVADLPRTDLGERMSGIISPDTFNRTVRGFSATILQLLLLIGAAIYFFAQRKAGQKERYAYALILASVAALGLVTLLPQLSVDYSVTRLFQQTLIIAAIPIVLAAKHLAAFFGRIRFIALAAFFGFLFLHLSGFVPQTIGGYPPQMSLNNRGIYYGLYYSHKGELGAGKWLINVIEGEAVVADYSALRLPNYPFQNARLISPAKAGETTTKMYIFQDRATLIGDTYTSFISGDIIQYKLLDQAERRDLVFANEFGRVYAAGRDAP